MFEQDLHNEGAKNFLVINIPAFGCIPLFLASSAGPFNATDKIGCLKGYNELARFSNLELDKALFNLNQQLPEIVIAIGDIYAFMIDIFRHPSNYGNAYIIKMCTASFDINIKLAGHFKSKRMLAYVKV